MEAPIHPPLGLRTVRVRAPGKINVSFRVGPGRADGYHSVASVYLAVSLYEEVAATATAEPGITIGVRNAGPGDGGLLDVPLDSRNLAYRAAALMADVSEHSTGVHLEITKSVPVAGGMGGGSADAAATLLACDALWDSGLSREELAHIGAELGADVPFALLGGAAVGLGVGDELSPALATGELHWVLVQAGYGLATPEVYRALDRLRLAEGREPAAPEAVEPGVLAALRRGDAAALATVLGNDLEPAAIELSPGLAAVLENGMAAGALTGLVSGSGPTVALLARSAEDAAAIAGRLCADGLDASTVVGPVPGARII
ncbi:MAG: 4-(cytidine 5'-diphospho)-2-C-methyl-D-erythritol kinase [Actinomycetales bacterium]